MGSYAYWIATAVAFVVSVFCAVAEGALLSYSPSRLEEQLKDPKRKKRLEAYLGQVDHLIFSSIVLNAMSDVALVFACTLGFYRGNEGALSGVWAIATSMIVVIVGAEVVPRAFSAFYAEPLLPRVLPPLALADKLFWPVIYPLRRLHDAIARALAGDTSKERRAEEIKDDILSAALEGSREGVLDQQASQMIENVIDFRDVEVRTIMTPRAEMAALEVGTTIEEAVKIALDQGHSRIPVYEGTRDKISGVLYQKDLLVAWGANRGATRKDVSLRSLLRKPYFVPETKLIGDLLREFRERKVHIAIILDEYGGTAGLVTIEDIIEEIVGEIEDEYDQDEGDGDQPALKRVDATTSEIDARAKIDEVNEKLGLALPEDGEYETLGGFLLYAMGRVPKKGERFTHEGAEFTVLEGDERSIKRLRLKLVKPQPAP